MSAFPQLEKALDNVFVKKAPALPAGGKKALVEWLPWINLVFGVLTLWAALALWQWAHVANNLINYANELSTLYGGTAIVHDRLTAGLWLALVVLIIEAVLYLLAFPATRARRKNGWDLMFYAALVNIVYGVIAGFFTDYGASSFIGTLIGSAIGLYFLFQIRSHYLGSKAAEAPKS